MLWVSMSVYMTESHKKKLSERQIIIIILFFYNLATDSFKEQICFIYELNKWLSEFRIAYYHNILLMSAS